MHLRTQEITSAYLSSFLLHSSQRGLVIFFYTFLHFLQDPTQQIHPMLTMTRQISLGAYKHETDFEEKKKTSLADIKAARIKVFPSFCTIKYKS